MIYLYIYLTGTLFVLFVTILLWGFREIFFDNFWDYLGYCLLWPLKLIKAIVKNIIK